MSRLLVCFVAALTGLAACSSLSNGSASNGSGSVGNATGIGSGEAAATTGDLAGDAGKVVDASFAKPSSPQAEATKKLDELVASFWTDPAFRRSFAESYLRGSEVDPAMTPREAEFRTEVLELISQEEYDNAISRLKSRQDKEASAELDYLLGNIYYGRDKYAEAAREFTLAVGKYPSFRRAWNNLAQVRMRLEDFRGAADAFVRVINLGGGDALTYGFLGLMHSRAEDYIAAEWAFRTAAMMEPDRVQWRLQLAEALLKQLRFSEVASLTGGLIQQDKGKADYWLYQARAFVGMNQPARAAENLEVVYQLGGATAASLTLLGNIYFNDGLYDLAAGAWLRGIEVDKKGDFRSAVLSANRLAARSAYDASTELVKGIEVAYADRLDDAARLELLHLRARFAADSGADEEQAALLEEIVAKNPLDGAALIQLGRYYADHDDVEKAILRYEQAAAREEFAAEAKFKEAQLLVTKSRLAEALPLLKAAQSLKPNESIQKLLDYVERVSNRTGGKK